jgi:hypothetical protein
VLALIAPAGFSVIAGPPGSDQVTVCPQVKGINDHAPPAVPSAPPESGGVAQPDLDVLACRIAGEVVHHEPGWRLPRSSVLARRFGVTPDQVAEAVDQLEDRHLVRRLPDGQFSRVSPAEYHIPLSSAGGMRAVVTPVEGKLACRSSSVSRQSLRDDMAWALGVPAGSPGCALRLQFTVDDEPAALSTTYVAASFRPVIDRLVAAGPVELLPIGCDPEASDDSRGSLSVQLELQQPAPAVASMVHLLPGEQAVVITARVDMRPAGGPAALTVAVLRPDLFAVTIESADRPLPPSGDDDYSAAWLHCADPDPLGF